jgi:hypothetical protein
MLNKQVRGDQLNLEFFSANLYLQMSAWCSDKGFEGAASFLNRSDAQSFQQSAWPSPYKNMLNKQVRGDELCIKHVTIMVPVGEAIRLMKNENPSHSICEIILFKSTR